MPGAISATTLSIQIGSWIFKYLSTKVLDEFKDRWLKPLLKRHDVEKSFSNAISNALTEFQQQYPDLYQSLFDETFVEQHAVPELSKLLRRTDKPDVHEIAASYSRYFQASEPPNIEDAIAFFVSAVSENMKVESVLQEQILKEGSNHFLTEKMSGLLPIEAERVYQVCMALLDQRKDDIASIGNGFAVNGDELINISLTLQRIGSHRKKGLELFERLLDLDAYGIRDTLFELDRRPSLDGAPPRQRRRRKKS